MSKMKNRNFIFFITEFCVFLLTLTIHIYFTIHMKAPQYVDEYRTFLTGTFLSGRYDLSLLHTYAEQTMYYGFGQVLFYIPFFYLFDSFDMVFQAALIFNSLVLSLIPVLALKCFRRLLPDCDDIHRAGMAFAAGLFSPLIYSSKTVTNEAFLLFVPVLILYILVLLSYNDNKKKKWILSAVLGFLGMYMYTLNARGLAITASVFICVFFMEVIRREKKIEILPYGVASALVYGINHILKNYIIQSYHQPFSGVSVRNSDIKLLQRLQNFITGNFMTAFSAWCGNWLYIVVVSGGLIALLLIVLFVKKKQQEDNIVLYAVSSTIITCGMLFFVNYSSNSNPKTQLIDYYIYGRYYDPLIPIILVVGLAILYQYRDMIKYHIIAGALILITGGCSVALLAPILIETNSSDIRILNIGVFTAFLDNTFLQKPSYWHFVGISIAILLFYGLVVLLGKNKKFLLLTLLFSGCYIYAGAYVMESCERTSLSAWNDLEQYRGVVSEYEQLDTSYKTIYYLYDGGTKRAVNIQYALNNWRVSQVDLKSSYNEDLGMITENSFILTKKEMFLDLMLKDCVFLREENGNYLYAYGQELVKELNSASEDRTQISLVSLLTLEKSATGLLISNGAHSYGPYIHLNAGTYYVEIEGAELAEVQVEVTKDMATEVVESQVLEQRSEKISLLFTSNVGMENIEISVYNSVQKYVIIDYMCVKNQQGELLFETDGKHLRSTEPVNMNVIRGMEEMYLEFALLEEGRYVIRIEGMNMDALKLICDETEEIQLEELERRENCIVYELTCHDFIKYPVVRIVSRTSKQKVIEAITIE